MRHCIYIVLLLIMVPNFVLGYNKIIQFDENEEIIVSTTVYNLTGEPCLNCDCNFTLFNPSPNESFINLSIQMENKGNGIFVANVSNKTTLIGNKNIYPLTLVCNNTNGVMGGDDRVGIKVSETLFDYTSAALILLGFGFALMFGSFKVDKQFWDIRKLMFFTSFAFLIGALFFGLFIVLKSPGNTAMVATFTSIIGVSIFLLLAIYFLYYKHTLVRVANTLGKGKFK